MKYLKLISGWYDDIVEASNPHIKQWKHTADHDYQGEWFSAGRKNGKIYFIQGSFGSCSGCDWLENVTTEEEAEEFVTTMQKLIPVGKEKTTTKEEWIDFMKLEEQNLWFGRSSLKDLKDIVLEDWFS
jgi:hypothetical protein